MTRARRAVRFRHQFRLPHLSKPQFLNSRNRRKIILYAVFYWVLLAAFSYIVPPGHIVSYGFFYGLCGLALASTFHAVLSRQLSIAFSFFFVGYLFLRQLRVDTPLTILLLVAVTAALLVFFRSNSHHR